jgi:hypothetical protein
MDNPLQAEGAVRGLSELGFFVIDMIFVID